MSVNRKPKSTSLIWVTSGTKLSTYDVLTKELTVVGDTGRTMYDIAMAPDGTLYGIDSTGNNLFTIDRSTAKCTQVTVLSPEGFVNSLTFNQHGVLYACQGTNLVKIHPITGVVTILGDIGVGSAGDLVFFNNNLYMSSNQNTLMLIDIGSPANSTAVSEIPTTYGLATVYISEGFSGNYHLYGTSGDNKTVYEIDPHNGVLSNRSTMASFGEGDSGVTNGATSSQFTWI